MTAVLFGDTAYQAYTYAYPHKTAYRQFAQAVPLDAVWAQEDKSSLFLYLHIPFCEMRCGFCNLFTTANPQEDLERSYLEALQRQAEQVRAAIGPAHYSRWAIGGGTPTYLEAATLDRLLSSMEDLFSLQIESLPTSVETSPQTSTSERLAVLRTHQVDRISMGIQSFVDAEVRGVGRNQRAEEVQQALDRLRQAGFPLINVDLIYGLPGQTAASWEYSLRLALEYAPEEIYLYPLYVRPLTGMDKLAKPESDQRQAFYRQARALLSEAGYQQQSMRLFRAGHASTSEGPVYCCQEDGMVGLGCGARSYTRGYHYSSEYAVGARGVKAILHSYSDTSAQEFRLMRYGFALSADDQRRRYVIQSILQREGLALAAYTTRFGSDPYLDLPLLGTLRSDGYLQEENGVLLPTSLGLEYSDAIGPALYSEHVKTLMEGFDLR